MTKELKTEPKAKKQLLTNKFVKVEKPSRRGIAPSFAESAALLAAATKRKGGGNGIPGGRRFADVTRLKKLDIKKYGTTLKSIISQSRELRKIKKEGAKINNKEFAEEHNRQIVYPNQFDNTSHSLHVGQDIAAVFNTNKTGGSRTYDYPTLTKSLDKRLESNQSSKGKRKGEYFDANIKTTANKRREKIAAGVSARLTGDMDKGQEHFQEIGLTKRGQKWVDKFSTIMFAEKAREIDGNNNGKLLNTALNHLKTNSFQTVFVNKRETMAPFAGKGGAKEFKQ